jgi:hypothetical protein
MYGKFYDHRYNFKNIVQMLTIEIRLVYKHKHQLDETLKILIE